MSPDAKPWYACLSAERSIIRWRETYHVKQGEVFLGLDQFRELLPLLLSGIDTSGVLGTCMEQELGSQRNGLARSVSDIRLNHPRLST
jgi:hypothetical protein